MEGTGESDASASFPPAAESRTVAAVGLKIIGKHVGIFREIGLRMGRHSDGAAVVEDLSDKDGESSLFASRNRIAVCTTPVIIV